MYLLELEVQKDRKQRKGKLCQLLINITKLWVGSRLTGICKRGTKRTLFLIKVTKMYGEIRRTSQGDRIWQVDHKAGVNPSPSFSWLPIPKEHLNSDWMKRSELLTLHCSEVRFETALTSDHD